MRKLAILMSVLLVAALAGTASAGINTHIGGKVWANLFYHLEDGPHAKGGAEVNVGLSAGTEGGNIQAFVSMDGWNAKSEGPYAEKPYTGSSGLNLSFGSAYIQANGSWIKGMPSTTTKIGRFGTNYSDWVANFRTLNGIEVSGIDLGVGSLSILAARTGADDEIWHPGANQKGRVFAATASANIDVVNVKGTFVQNRDDNDLDNPHSDFAIEASLSPVDGLSINADFASDGISQESAYRIGANLSTVPNVNLNVETWSTGKDFDPAWSSRTDGNEHEGVNNERAKYTKDSKGFKVGVNTNQSGIALGLTYTNENNIAETNQVSTTEVTAGTKVSDFDVNGKVTMKSNETNAAIEASIGTNLSGVNTKYTLNIGHDQKVKHTVNADTTVDLPIADNVKLEGRAVLEEGQDTRFAAGASWQAPNGINLGLFWSNLDRVEGDPGWSDDGFADKAGFLIKASIEVGF